MRLSDSSQSDWWQTGVVYQIYPRSFADASGDGIGDLAGIRAHLDHLNDGTEASLGVDAIWLSPIYPSPDFDFGYDVADYLDVDPRFGTLADFQALVDASHERGIKVILDLVLNHSSHLHPWFVASRSSRTGEYADWYVWADARGRAPNGRPLPPNNWRSWFGGAAWTWDPNRRQFYLHTFLPQQPDLNWRHPPVREAMMDVVRTWLDRGVDGFRLDVFNAYYKDAQLRSNPWRVGRRRSATWQQHRYDRNQPELEDALREMRAIVDARPGRMTVGELFDGTVEMAARYTAPRHLIFDFSFMRTPWDARAFAAAVAQRERIFGAKWPTVVLSNHDQPRHASRFDHPRFGDARAKVAATMLLTLRGTAFMYYGEEIGMRNLRIPKEIAQDPPARRATRLFPFWNRDQARGPMAWTADPDGGFGTNVPWLPLSPDARYRNVATESADPHSLLWHYRRLLHLRRATPALNEGSYEQLDLGGRGIFSYRRLAGRQAAVVILAFTDQRTTVTLPVPPADGGWTVLSSTHRESGGRIERRELEIVGNEALILVGT